MFADTNTSDRRLNGTAIALITLGVWGALVPFLGPSFGYGMGGVAAFTWTESHATLHLAPGIAAIVGGLLLLRGRGRSIRLLGASVAAAAGAWFAVAPSLHPLWAPATMSGMGGMGTSAWSSALSSLGYHYGTGVLIAIVAAYAVGVLAATRDEAYPAGVSADSPSQSGRSADRLVESRG